MDTKKLAQSQTELSQLLLEQVKIRITIWNETLANLSLMATCRKTTR